MTPQTALEDPGAITPVIVKSGGDPLVSIESSSVPFVENVPGFTWSSSQSTKTGRIRKLKVKDGDLIPADLSFDPTSELASVLIGFGPAQLIAMESGVPAENNVLLLLTSPEVQFSVTPGADWILSTSQFPNKIRAVRLMFGDQRRFSYDFQTDDVTVEIYFN